MAATQTTEGLSRARIAMWVLALALGGILTFVIYSYIGTFVLGLFIYYITRPIHRRIASRIPTSTLAAAVSLTVLALPLILLFGYTVYVGAFQLAAFAETQDLTAVSNALQPYLGSLGGGGSGTPSLSAVVANPEQFVGGSATDTAQRVLVSAAGYLSVLGNGLIQLFIVLALAFYLLRDDHRISGWFRDELAGEGTPVYYYFATVDRDLKTIFFGNILNAFAVAILGAVSYLLLNLFAPSEVVIPSPVLVGLLVGVGSLVPVVGMKIVYVPVALLLAVEAAIASPALLWFPIAFTVVSLLVVDTIPDLVLRPYVSGRDMHTGAVMIAYIVGPLLFGWYGLFLGPLLLVAMVHFARIILPELVRGETLTSRSSADSPLDPSDREAPEPEPEPVEMNTETEADSEGGGTETDGAEASAGAKSETERSRSPETGSTRESPVGTSESDSSADRVRSTWDDESSATDGGNPRNEEDHRSGGADED